MAALADYQQEIDDFVQGYEKPYWSIWSQFARLVEEVGELGRALNHEHGDKIKKASEEPDDIEGEMGDILFDLMCMANTKGIDLDHAIAKVIHKAKTRDKDRFPKKAV
ncbi:nucleotide pyrophosphohydrolase [Polaromonas sp.]|nr:nucleotide pyrophosphohydrolase [Candidatus Saccharibacteria bacterium]